MKKYLSFVTDRFIPMLPNMSALSVRHPKKSIRIIYNHFAHDSLYKNSIYLMLSTGVMSFFGFFFWYLNAKLFSPKDIGYATAIISIVNLLASISIFGLDGGLVRFLPKSHHKNGKITIVMTIIVIISIILSVVYLLNIQIFSPGLLFIKRNIILFLAFIIFVACTALNNITNSIFIAYRSSKYCFITNAIFSIVKAVLPFTTIALGSVGVCLSVLAGIVVSLVISIIILIYKFNYHFDFTVNKTNTRHMYNFAFGTYVSGLIGGLPMQVLPIIIINKLKPEISAYFYIDMMIIGLIYMIPISTVQSLFAESSHEETRLKENIFKSIRINLFTLVPAIIITILAGKYILLIFGKEYSTEGLSFLWIMALSSMTVPVNYIFSAYYRIEKKITYINIAAVISAVTTLLVCYLAIPLGLYGIGVGLICGQIAQVTFYVAISSYSRLRR